MLEGFARKDGFPERPVKIGFVAAGLKDARGFSKNLFFRVTGRLFKSGVDVLDDAVFVGDNDIFRRLFDGGGKVFELQPRLFGVFVVHRP